MSRPRTLVATRRTRLLRLPGTPPLRTRRLALRWRRPARPGTVSSRRGAPSQAI